MTKWEYVKLISKRGDANGGNTGVLDLLSWCGKANTLQVTEEEARLFWENPLAPHPSKAPDSSGR